MGAFAELELGRDAIPDETTILNFRHLLERHELTKAIFAAVAEHLAAKGRAPSRRHDRGRDADRGLALDQEPGAEARSRDEFVEEGKPVVFRGMKAHVGVDAESGLVHTAGVTTGKVHDAKVMANLIREDDAAVYGDKGYASDEKKRAAEAAGVLWAVKEKAKLGRDLTQRQRARNRRFGKVRAKVEHVFRVLKCQFGYRKAKCRLTRCSPTRPLMPISGSSSLSSRPARRR